MSNPNDGFTFEVPGLGVMLNKPKPKPQQTEVPGFQVWLTDCRRDRARLKGERSGRPLPLFDHLDDTLETDSAGLSSKDRRFKGMGRGGETLKL